MRRLSVLLLAPGLAVALAACGGSSNSSSSSKGSTSKDSGSASSDSGSSDYSKLVEKGKTAKFKVTYKTADGSTWTIAQDPPKSAYIVGDTAIYEDGNGSAAVCSGTGTDVQCFKTEGSGSSSPALGLITNFQSVLDTKNLPGTTRVSDREIAGQSAKCVSYSPPLVKNSSVETCVDKNTGIALLVKSTVSGSSVLDLEATKVETPKASDFTPPATPQDINSLMPSVPTT
jgi:hypothetical protein